jgi:hypothetical protein
MRGKKRRRTAAPAVGENGRGILGKEDEILRSNFGRFWEEEKSEESLTPYFEHSKIILQVSK